MNKDLLQTARNLYNSNERFLKKHPERLFHDMYALCYKELTESEYSMILSNDNYLTNRMVNAQNDEISSDQVGDLIDEMMARTIIKMYWDSSRDVYSLNEDTIERIYSEDVLKFYLSPVIEKRIRQLSCSKTAFMIDFSESEQLKEELSASGALVKIFLKNGDICAGVVFIDDKSSKYSTFYHSIFDLADFENEKIQKIYPFEHKNDKNQGKSLPLYVVYKLILLAFVSKVPDLLDDEYKAHVNECSGYQFREEGFEDRVIGPKYSIIDENVDESLQFAFDLKPKFRYMSYEKARKLSFECESIKETLEILKDDTPIMNEVLKDLPELDLENDPINAKRNMDIYLTRCSEAEKMVRKDTIVRVWEQNRVIYRVDYQKAQLNDRSKVFVCNDLFDKLVPSFYIQIYEDTIPLFYEWDIKGVFIKIQETKTVFRICVLTDQNDSFNMDILKGSGRWIFQDEFEKCFEIPSELEGFYFTVLKLLEFISAYQDRMERIDDRNYDLTTYVNRSVNIQKENSVLISGTKVKSAHAAFSGGTNQSSPNEYLPLVVARHVADQMTEIHDTFFVETVKKWSNNKQVYIFDDDFLQELLRTERFTIPKDTFNYMPYQSFYIDVSANAEVREMIDADGLFFATLEHDDSTSHVFVPIKKDANAIMVGQICTHNLYCEKDIEVSVEEYAASEIAPKYGYLSMQILTYLCSIEPDIRINPQSHYRAPKNGKIVNHISETQVWDVGVRFGNAYRKWKSSKTYEQNPETKGTGSKKRPHSRRAHWSHYWYKVEGSDEKVKRPKWIYEIMVGTGNNVTTIHKVKKDEK